MLMQKFLSIIVDLFRYFCKGASPWTPKNVLFHRQIGRSQAIQQMCRTLYGEVRRGFFAGPSGLGAPEKAKANNNNQQNAR
jgi:hypothetical protein